MLPPQSTVPTLRPWKRSRVGQNGREPSRTRPFDHQLLLRDQGVDRALQAFLADEDDIVHQFADDLPRDVARRFDGDAFRDGGAGAGNRLSGQRLLHGWIEFGFDPDHLDIRLDRLRGSSTIPRSTRRRRWE